MRTAIRRSSLSRAAMVGAVAIIAAGCAGVPKEPGAVGENDPFEATNRGILAFNRGADENVGKPVARAYRAVVPALGRASIRNFLNNMEEPVNFVNALLQGRDDRAAETAVRFIFNSTAGMGGLFDPAASYGLARNQEDFGQTLAVWGVAEGPYIMLPLLGPSNARDLVGKAVDNFTNPIGYFMPTAGSIAATLTDAVALREENLETIEDLEESSVDFYASLRNLYRQNRNDAITNGEIRPLDFDIEVIPD